MTFDFDYILPNSAYVTTIWRTRTEAGGSFISRAASQWEMVITKQQGKTTFTVRGPTTRASLAPVPEAAEFVGIQFKQGSFIPHLPSSQLVDSELNLPDASSKSIWLNGSAWQLPDFENAEAFVEKLVKDQVLQRDALVQAVLQGEEHKVSERTVQRRFLQVTGLSQVNIRQIERARAATELLEKGTPIADVVFSTGYSDQAHMTRALKLYAGQTSAQLLKAH
ncbi:MAG: AraC family transcriptional regulator [Trueperaceae bacterium]|nr:AraC family transcriptional regulator [Trueperaceae bacterium]